MVNVGTMNHLNTIQESERANVMAKMRTFEFIEGSEAKTIEAMSYRKAVKSYQSSSKATVVTVEWPASKGGYYTKQQTLPLGRKKKISRQEYEMAGIKQRGVQSIHIHKTHNGVPVRLTKYYKSKGGAVMCPLNPETGELFFKDTGEVVTYGEYSST